MLRLLQRGAAVTAWAAVACAGRGRPSAQAPSSPARAVPDAAGAWQKLASYRSRALEFGLLLRLPAGPGVRVADGPIWLSAEDITSRSELAVRVWRAARRVRPADCEAEARLARPSLPRVAEDSVVERRKLDAPPGFYNQLTVFVRPASRGIIGGALVFGASVGRCYAATFVTLVEGPDAPVEVARRLRLVVSDVFESVRVLDVEQRALGQSPSLP